MKAFASELRRVVMRQTRNLVYYLHDAANAVVNVLAVWGLPNGATPCDPKH